MQKVVIYGNGKIAKVVYEYIKKEYEVVAFCVNKEYLLVSLFDDRTLPGVVKVAGKEFSMEAVKILRNES